MLFQQRQAGELGEPPYENLSFHKVIFFLLKKKQKKQGDFIVIESY